METITISNPSDSPEQVPARSHHISIGGVMDMIQRLLQIKAPEPVPVQHAYTCWMCDAKYVNASEFLCHINAEKVG